MTLICFKNGIIASDSRVTAGSEIVSEHYKKIFKFKQYVLAIAGDVAACSWFPAWLSNDFKLKPISEADMVTEAILVDRDKQTLERVWSSGLRDRLSTKTPYAMGSGVQAAMLAMTKYKASPEEAIKSVAKFEASVNRIIQRVKCW